MIVSSLGAIAVSASRVASTLATSGSYVPNCTGTYNPCDEVEKAKAVGMQVPKSIAEKCAAFQSKCGRGADQAVVKASVTRYMTNQQTSQVGERYSATSGDTGQVISELPDSSSYPDTATATPWYMNKTYWLIGGAVLVGVLLLRR